MTSSESRFLSDKDFGPLIVHGHMPVSDGIAEHRRNRVNVDMGAVYGRALAAVVLVDDITESVRFLTAL